MKHELKRISIWSAGKVMGLFYAAMTLLFLPFSFLFFGAGIFTAAKGHPEGFGVAGLGIFMLFSPLIYGAMGFLAGILGALVYNLISKKIGGLVFETAPRE